MRSLRNQVVVLVGAVLVVGLLAVAAGYVLADGGLQRSDAAVSKGYYTDRSVVQSARLTAASGSIQVDSAGESVVLVKHSGPPAAIEPITRALTRAGHEVRYVKPGGQSQPGESRLNASLSGADALLVVGAGGFTEPQLDGVEAFAGAGGRVVIAHDATMGGPRLAIAGIPARGLAQQGGAPPSALTARFGVTLGRGYLYNMAENDQNHKRVFAGASGALGDGVDRLVVDTAAPLFGGAGSTVASAAGETHYSVSRESGTYAVAVRNGDVVVLGNTAMLSETDDNRADNEVFLGNLLRFLTSGTKVPAEAPATDSDGPGEGPPEPPTTPGGGEG